MFNKLYKTIYKKIKKYDTIVIARHVGADPDSLSSQIALRDIISNTFPNKKVYAVGFSVSRFKYLGILDKENEEMYNNSLLIVLDTPDKKRVDGVDVSRFTDSIKIDHHPYIETFCNYEWIDDKASSASQMVVELVFNTKLVMTREAAEKLYIGIVSDTNRFLFSYTTPKTFSLISKLIKETNIDFTSLYNELYIKSIRELRFQGYVANTIRITDNGLGYLLIDDAILKEYGVDASTARNMVANFNYVDELIVWMMATIDSDDLIKGSIRSRGPVINEIASNFNGGGHAYASGIRLTSTEQMNTLIEKLDTACKIYKDNE